MASVSIGLRVEHDAERLAARFEEIPSRVDLALRDATAEGADILARSERETIPYREHPGAHVRDTIAATMPRKTGAGWEAEAGTNDEIARYLEEGTPPHRIGPTARRLAAYQAARQAYQAARRAGKRPGGKTPRPPAVSWPGARHPMRAVNHPGTRPYLWLEAAGEAGQPAVEAAFERRIGEVLKGV